MCLSGIADHFGALANECKIELHTRNRAIVFYGKGLLMSSRTLIKAANVTICLLLLHSLQLVTPDNPREVSLHLNLNTTLTPWCATRQRWEKVRDIIPRMSVKTGPQSLLVKVMGNQTDASA